MIVKVAGLVPTVSASARSQCRNQRRVLGYRLDCPSRDHRRIVVLVGEIDGDRFRRGVDAVVGRHLDLVAVGLGFVVARRVEHQVAAGDTQIAPDPPRR